MNWYLEVLRKYAVFNGRARRKEYWFFALFTFIISVVLIVIDGMLAGSSREEQIGLLYSIYSLATLIPGLAVSVRRLHDTSRSAWWILIVLVPIAGGIVYLLFMAQDSKPGQNQYGANPKEASA